MTNPAPEFTPPADGSAVPDPFAEWEHDFCLAAAATCRQIAIAADALENAVGTRRFGVVAHLMLQKVIETSAEQANLMAGQREQQRAYDAEQLRIASEAAAPMRQFPRPNDPNWLFAGRP